MREIIQSFLKEFFHLLKEAYYAPAAQAEDAMWALAALLLQLLIIYLTLRWVYRKLK
jgi:hypothetical protein